MSATRTTPGAAGGAFSAWGRFWLGPTDPRALHLLRVLTGLVVLAWLLGFAGHQLPLFALDGWFDGQAYREAARLPGSPVDGKNWSLLYAVGNNPALLDAAYWGTLAVVALFTLGIATRVTSVLTWVAVASFIANPATTFDADYLLAILTFYLMVGYLLVGQWGRPLSLAERVLGPHDAMLFRRRTAPIASHGATLALRLIQVHFAVLIVSSGLHKLQFGDWWSGTAIWYGLNPPFETTPQSLREHARDAESYFIVLSLAQYAVLAWQLAFPVFAWRPRWRVLLLGGAVAGWVGSLVIYRLPLFGPVLVLVAVSFMTAADWRALAAVPGRLGARARRLLASLDGEKARQPETAASS